MIVAAMTAKMIASTHSLIHVFFTSCLFAGSDILFFIGKTQVRKINKREQIHPSACSPRPNLLKAFEYFHNHEEDGEDIDKRDQQKNIPPDRFFDDLQPDVKIVRRNKDIPSGIAGLYKNLPKTNDSSDKKMKMKGSGKNS